MEQTSLTEGKDCSEYSFCEVQTWTWERWIEEALSSLESKQLLQSPIPIHLPITTTATNNHSSEPNEFDHEEEVFDVFRQWDRAAVEVEILDSVFKKWVDGTTIIGKHDIYNGSEEGHSEPQPFRKLLSFSSNDYLSLASHPTVTTAASRAVKEHGMGPRGSAIFCGYTSYHRLLEDCLVDLKKKEDCLLCPTGYSANMSFMSAIGYVGSFLVSSKTVASEDERVAVFSDALNHASIIDGIRLADRQGSVKVFIYEHCDMSHLNELLSSCTMKKKVVITDSLFSMDGEFAPMIELAKLRKKHGFLLVIDEAHATLVCGKNGGGVAEEFGCENDVDISIGTLSKAAASQGGFIACSKRWKQLIQSRGRAFMFSTCLPVPVAAAAHAAVVVAKKETWRRTAIWNRVREFQALTGILVTSPIISLVVGSEEKALQASRHLLRLGFHTIAVRPPIVPPNMSRLRLTLNAAHTRDDVRKLVSALSECQILETVHCATQVAMPSSTI